MVAVAYAIRIEDLARDVHALTISAGLAVALGGDPRLPDWETAKAAFDEDLNAPIESAPATAADYNSARATKLRALGVE